MVKDEEDRWWSKSPRTGEWYRRTVSGAWVEDVPPPPYQAVTAEPATEEVPAQTEPAEDDGTEDEGNRRRVLFRVFSVLALLLLAVLGFVVYILLNPPPPPPPVAVPDLVGMKLDEAENRYSDKIDIRVEREVESKEPVDTIRRQDPESGKVKKGSTIWVDVVDTQVAEVPGVSGKEADEAQKILDDAKFNVAEEEEQSSSEEEGSVIGQDPAGGTTVEVGSEVTITVGTGPPQDLTTVVTPPPDETTQAGPPPTVRVDDDFSDTSSGWVGDPLGRYSDGGYVLSSGDQRAAVNWNETPGTLKDAIVEVDATDKTIDPTGTNFWGVVCRLQDSNNFYEFDITNTGQASIGKYYGNGRIKYLAGPKSSEAIDPMAINHLRAECVGSTLTMYVNEQKLLETKDTTFSSGYFGLYTSDGLASRKEDLPGSVKVLFDNFKVRKP
jgi:PASTA domain